MEGSFHLSLKLTNLNDNTSFDTHLRHNCLGPRTHIWSFLFLCIICMDIFKECFTKQTTSPKPTNSRIPRFRFQTKQRTEHLNLLSSSYQGQEPLQDCSVQEGPVTAGWRRTCFFGKHFAYGVCFPSVYDSSWWLRMDAWVTWTFEKKCQCFIVFHDVTCLPVCNSQVSFQFQIGVNLVHAMYLLQM